MTWSVPLHSGIGQGRLCRFFVGMAFGGLGLRGAGSFFSGVNVLSGWEPESGSWVERGVGRGEGAATTSSSSESGAKIVDCPILGGTFWNESRQSPLFLIAL